MNFLIFRHNRPIVSHRILVLVCGMFLFSSLSLYATVSHGVDLTLLGGLGYSSKSLRDRGDVYDYLSMSGNTKLAYTLSGRGETVRGQAQITVRGTTSMGMLLELSRAYIRTRIPVGEHYNLQFELGKNTLYWGEGNYYNAGDVIFSSDPKNASLTSTDFRDYTIWQFRLLIPVNDFVYFESVLGVPEQLFEQNDDTQTIVTPVPTIERLGAGIRLHAETGALHWEVGAYDLLAMEEVAPYISIALPLVVRTYLAASTSISYAEKADDPTSQLQKESAVSMGLLFTRGIGREGQLSIQPEVLYKNMLWYVQIDSSLQIIRTLGILLRANARIYEEQYSILVGPQWTPEAGVTLAVLSSNSLDYAEKHDNTIYFFGVAFLFQYKY